MVPVARNSSTTIKTRYNFAVKFSELVASQRKLFFIDETGIQVHARTNYGRSLRGMRANKRVRAVRGRNYSICAAMDSESLYFYEAQAIEYNAVDFTEYLGKIFDFLARDGIMNAIIVTTDNVRFHHVESVVDTIERSGHEVLFLPPYSPFLNPIENLFNQLKYYVKKYSPDASDAVELASEAISEADCKNYFKNRAQYIPRCLRKETIKN